MLCGRVEIFDKRERVEVHEVEKRAPAEHTIEAEQCLFVFLASLDERDKLHIVKLTTFDWSLLPYLLDLRQPTATTVSELSK